MKPAVLFLVLLLILFLIGMIFTVSTIKKIEDSDDDEFNYREDSTLQGQKKVVKLKRVK